MFFCSDGEEAFTMKMELRNQGNVRKILTECCCERVWCHRFVYLARCVFFGPYNPVQAVVMLLKLVDTGIETNQQEKNDTRGDPNGQAENIDQCIVLVALEIPERECEIVSYHAIAVAKVYTNIVFY